VVEPSVADAVQMEAEGRFAEAVEAFLAAARAGAPHAAYRLDRLGHYFGVEGANYAEIRQLLEAAAEDGDALARTNLAIDHIQGGLGMAVDADLGCRLLEDIIADSGHPRASATLGAYLVEGHCKDPEGKTQVERGRDLLMAAMEAGDPRAAFMLGSYYESGQYPEIPQDDGAALSAFEAAKARGFTADEELGRFREYGRGGKPADSAAAAEHYRRGAEAHDAGALFRLGWALEHGRGVATDLLGSARAYRRGALLGSKPANSRLEWLDVVP
jgi:TPR repeat protein